MSQELTEYLSTTDSLLSRIEGESAKSPCNPAEGGNSASASIDKTMSAVVGSMNESIGFSNFYTSGRFYIQIALKTEVPTAITRDHERLGKELERIQGVIELVHNQCGQDIVPSSNLSEDTVYNTSGKTLGTILKEVLKNQVDMMNLYRETVLGDQADGQGLILVGNPQNFVSQLQSHYGPKAFEACVKKRDFFKDVGDAFDRITTKGGNIEQGMDDWGRAWKLLNSNSSDREYADVERNVLRDEMSRQGMGTKGSSVIMNNLAKYNGQAPSEGLTGFVSDIGERVYASIGQFGKSYDDLKAMLNRPQTTGQYLETTKVLERLKTDINEDIVRDYENAKSLIGPENQSADETVAKLIDTHILLETTNGFVQPYIKIAEQTCDEQATGKGNCRYK